MAARNYDDLPESDKQLIADFQKLLDGVSRIREKMYSRKAGCACDERGLCAHHAEVSNRLITVSDDLAKVIKAAQREG